MQMKMTSSNVVGAGPSPFIVRLTPRVPRGAVVSNDISGGGVKGGRAKDRKRCVKIFLRSEKSGKFHSGASDLFRQIYHYGEN